MRVCCWFPIMCLSMVNSLSEWMPFHSITLSKNASTHIMSMWRWFEWANIRSRVAIWTRARLKFASYYMVVLVKNSWVYIQINRIKSRSQAVWHMLIGIFCSYIRAHNNHWIGVYNSFSPYSAVLSFATFRSFESHLNLISMLKREYWILMQ